MPADHAQRSPEELVRQSLSRGTFLKATGGAVVGFTSLLGLAGTASADPGSDSTASILAAAITAEQIATVLYYEALAGPSSSNLGPVHNNNNLNYFQAALWQEYQHVQLLTGAGGSSLVGASPTIYFPSATFTKAGDFLSLLDTLENAFIGAYLAAVNYWASQTQAGLAEAAAQIMGTEAEHRALGRVASGTNPPNNKIVEEALFAHVSDAVGPLTPFVTGGSGFTSYSFPTEAQVRAAATSPIIQSITNPGLV